MRVLKICMIGALVMALAAPSWALTFNQPYNGPVHMYITGWDAGTVYTSFPPPTPGQGSRAGEDTWGVFKVTSLDTASVITAPPPGQIDGGGITIWSDSPTNHLYGVFWGEVDTAVGTSGSTQYVYGSSLNFAVWEQSSVYTNVGTGGRAASPADGIYAGIGGAGSTLVLTGTSTPGFFTLDPSIADPTIGWIVGGGYDASAEFHSEFTPASLGQTTGHAATYLSLGAVDVDGDGILEVGSLNTLFDTGFFQGLDPGVDGLPGTGDDVPTTADFYLYVTTSALNPGNLPVGGNLDWTVAMQGGSVTGIVIPEPVTMVGLLFSVVGVGGYLRRRRMAV